MASQTRRPSSKASRRERRNTSAARAYVGQASRGATPTRRSYLGEPAPIDYAAEYRFIRKDLLRILFWAGLLTIAMLTLWFLPVL